jgi:hypothetical protein
MLITKDCAVALENVVLEMAVERLLEVKLRATDPPVKVQSEIEREAAEAGVVRKFMIRATLDEFEIREDWKETLETPEPLEGSHLRTEATLSKEQSCTLMVTPNLDELIILEVDTKDD